MATRTGVQRSDRLALVTGRIHSTDSIQHEGIVSGSSLPEKELSLRIALDDTAEKPSLHRRKSIGERRAFRVAALVGFEEELSHFSSFINSIKHDSSVQGGMMDHQPEKERHHMSLTTSLPEKEFGQRDALDDTAEKPSVDYGNIGGSRAARAAALLGAEKELSQLLSILQRGKNGSSFVQGDVVDHQCEKMGHQKSLTSQISTAITASENVRMYCSIAAAILVILLNGGFPIPESKREQMSAAASLFRGDGIAQLGKALEVGLLLQNILVALFMDFSIYGVVLICGLATIKTFGG